MPDIRRYETNSRFSRAVVHNGVAYLSGLTASDLSADAGLQTREILEKADSLLTTVGARRADLLSATIWLKNIDDFAAMNSAWETWIDKDHPPARATVESRMALPDILVEIQFTAAIK